MRGLNGGTTASAPTVSSAHYSPAGHRAHALPLERESTKSLELSTIEANEALETA